MLYVPEAVGRSAPTDIVTTEIPGAGTVQLILGGAVDGQRVQAVHRSVIDLLRRHRPGCIDLDLSEVTVVDDAAVRGFQLCRADAAQLECRLAFGRASVAVQPVLAAAGLLDNDRERR